MLRNNTVAQITITIAAATRPVILIHIRLIHIPRCKHIAIVLATLRQWPKLKLMVDQTTSLLEFNQFQLSKKVVFLTPLSVYLLPLSKTVRNKTPLKWFWTSFWLQMASPLSKWVMLLHPRPSHLPQLTPHLYIHSLPLPPSLPDKLSTASSEFTRLQMQLSSRKNEQKHKKRKYIKLISGNKLILKPPLKIDKVIEHFTRNKINIKVVNLSSSNIDQMLFSDKGTKDSSRVQ